jgi:hypothetical protein
LARIRTIKPEFFLHDELFELEQETGLPVRLAFIGLWTQCDREGRFKWRPLRLKAAILPYDSVDMSRVLHALNTRGFLVKYANETGEYGVIPSFKNHQVINNKESKSDLPAVSDCEIVKSSNGAASDATVTRGERDDHANQGERKEGKGKERKELNTLSDSNRTGDDAFSEPENMPAQVECEGPEEADDGGDKSDPVDTVFEDIFWIAGLRKDAKVKSRSAFRAKYREWKKLKHGTPEDFASILAADIRRRVQASELGVDKLLPTSYLNGERWNDERSTPALPSSQPPGSSWCTPSTDGSAEIFINPAALARAHNGGYRS